MAFGLAATSYCTWNELRAKLFENNWNDCLWGENMRCVYKVCAFCVFPQTEIQHTAAHLHSHVDAHPAYYHNLVSFVIEHNVTFASSQQSRDRTESTQHQWVIAFSHIIYWNYTITDSASLLKWPIISTSPHPHSLLYKYRALQLLVPVPTNTLLRLKKLAIATSTSTDCLVFWTVHNARQECCLQSSVEKSPFLYHSWLKRVSLITHKPLSFKVLPFTCLSGQQHMMKREQQWPMKRNGRQRRGAFHALMSCTFDLP